MCGPGRALSALALLPRGRRHLSWLAACPAARVASVRTPSRELEMAVVCAPNSRDSDRLLCYGHFIRSFNIRPFALLTVRVFMRNPSHILMDMNSWFPVATTVWRRL